MTCPSGGRPRRRSSGADFVDYLVIGHVTHDLTPQGPTLGGTAAYSAIVARALGARVGILTSGPKDMALGPLDGIPVCTVESPQPSTFQNTYGPEGRSQRLLARAARLDTDAVPPRWRSPRIVHLGPVADEVGSSLAWHFPRSFVGATPQGWMRRWDPDGTVRCQRWQEAPEIADAVDALVLGVEDLADDHRALEVLLSLFRLVVVTQGASGATVYARGEQPVHVNTPPTHEIDPTGAGDVFAAIFFLALARRIQPVQAAVLASKVASRSVTFQGLLGAARAAEEAWLGCELDQIKTAG